LLGSSWPTPFGRKPEIIRVDRDRASKSRISFRGGAVIAQAPQADLAQQITKDPSTFDFLALSGDAHERERARGLVGHLRNFLLELGVGFAFVASQYRLEVGRTDFFVDLIFYHLKLRCFVLVDLKAKAFEPEFVGYGKPDVMQSAA
jgi:predicted nuclease of restriction endonuclease-like (RecB) superfamily